MATEPKNFNRPWLLLCEGLSDKQFFHKLIQFHGVCAGKFSIYFPSHGPRDGGGSGKFGRYLATLHATRPDFRENVKAVLIVADNDDDGAKAFSQIQASLKVESFPEPEEEKVVARKPDRPAVVVLMLPMGGQGNLETLCLQAAYNKWQIKPAVDSYVNAVPAVNWPLPKQSKMRLHSILAATCETKPETSFAHLWQEHQNYHIPLDDPCFTEVVEFLRNFEALLGDD